MPKVSGFAGVRPKHADPAFHCRGGSCLHHTGRIRESCYKQLAIALRSSDLTIDLSFLYPLYSIDPRSVWKGQFALLIAAAVGVFLAVIALDPDSRSLRWLKRCGVAGITIMTAVQFAVVIGYLFYPGYLNHAEANVASVSWLGWEGYPLYPRLDVGDVYGVAYGPALYQVTGFFIWLFGPSIGASKILGLTAFASFRPCPSRPFGVPVRVLPRR